MEDSDWSALELKPHLLNGGANPLVVGSRVEGRDWWPSWDRGKFKNSHVDKREGKKEMLSHCFYYGKDT